jgi:HEAT repeat protein
MATDSSSTMILSALRDFWRDQTPSSVLDLVQLAEAASTPKDLRAAAVWAISAIHTKEALPFLAGLLNSQDPLEQVRGMFGLGSFANGYPPQTVDNSASMDYLRTDSKLSVAFSTAATKANFVAGGGGTAEQLAPLVAFWRDWWNNNQAAITAQ